MSYKKHRLKRLRKLLKEAKNLQGKEKTIARKHIKTYYGRNTSEKNLLKKNGLIK
jgi:hypothetical protein